MIVYDSKQWVNDIDTVIDILPELIPSANTDELEIIVNPDTIKYEVLNNNTLKNKSKVVIKVVDDEGNYEYTINIIKEEPKPETSFNTICYLVFGIGVIAFVSSKSVSKDIK